MIHDLSNGGNREQLILSCKCVIQILDIQFSIYLLSIIHQVFIIISDIMRTIFELWESSWIDLLIIHELVII